MYMCVILREKEGNTFTIALIMNLILKALSIENIPEVKILTNATMVDESLTVDFLRCMY